MAHAGAPGANINNNPVIRKLEQKVQHAEKKLQEMEKREAELSALVKALEAKVAVLMRNVKELQQGSSPLLMAGPPPAAQNGHAASPSEEVFVTPAAPPPMSMARIDAALSNLGIRVVEVDHDFLEMEPLNAWGSENLRQLGNHVQVRAVERFIRQKENLA